jgi:hypothetical protein
MVACVGMARVMCGRGEVEDAVGTLPVSDGLKHARLVQVGMFEQSLPEVDSFEEQSDSG